jgi:transposase-like protein
MTQVDKKPTEIRPAIRTTKAQVYCPICTHTVEVVVRTDGKRAKVASGQKCPRCAGSIDAGVIMHIPQAA